MQFRKKKAFQEKAQNYLSFFQLLVHIYEKSNCKKMFIAFIATAALCLSQKSQGMLIAQRRSVSMKI